MNTLEYLLEWYPEQDWDWTYLSISPNITMEFIERHPDKPWDWNMISQNRNIDMEIIEQYPPQTLGLVSYIPKSK